MAANDAGRLAGMAADESPYAVPLDLLEAGIRIPYEEQVEEIAVTEIRDPGPGLPHPDREWFAAGG